MALIGRPRSRLAATLLVVAALSTACAGGGASPPPGTQGSVTTLNFWVRTNTKDMSTALVNKWNASHPDVQVKLNVTPAADDVVKLGTALASGEPIDVVALNDIFVPQWAEEGKALDITDKVKGLSYYKSLSPGHMRLATVSDKIYGVPFDADLSLIVYNKDLYRKAGLDPEKPPTNFAELIEHARKITALGNGTYGFGFGGSCSGCFVFTGLPFIWASGGDVLSPDGKKVTIESSPAVRDALELYRTLWAEKLANPASQGETGATWGADLKAGKTGIVPFNVQLATSAKEAGVDVGVAPIVGKNGGTSTFAGGDNLIIIPASKNKDAAWTFIEWLTDQEQQLMMPEYGFTPVRSDIVTPDFQQKYPFVATALKVLPNGNAPYSPHWLEVTAPSSPWLTMWQEAIFDGDIDGAIKRGQAAFAAVIE